MDVAVNYWAVILAGISAMVVGSIWYSRVMFQKPWEAMARIDKKRGRKELPMVMTVTFLASLLMAYVLAHVAFLSNQFFGNSFLQDTLSTAFWLWLGISTPALLTGGLFEQRRKKLILMNLGNQLVTLIVMALIIGSIGIS
jgi:hypothetical protein